MLSKRDVAVVLDLAAQAAAIAALPVQDENGCPTDALPRPSRLIMDMTNSLTKGNDT